MIFTVGKFFGSDLLVPLRFVNKQWNESLRFINPNAKSAKHFVSSLSLYTWAIECLGMPSHSAATRVAVLRSGLIEIVLLLEQRAGENLPWNETDFANAVIGSVRNLHTVRWLRAQEPPCPWSSNSSMFAAFCGHLHVLHWLRAQNPPCPWDERTTHWAAYSGNLPILEWVRSVHPPCPWDDWTCSMAVEGGHLHVLQWLRAQDPPCPWDETTCHVAAREGQLHILQWLRAQDPPCPWNWNACATCSATHGHARTSHWIHQVGL
jgi:hypothetical protein